MDSILNSQSDTYDVSEWESFYDSIMVPMDTESLPTKQDSILATNTESFATKHCDKILLPRNTEVLMEPSTSERVCEDLEKAWYNYSQDSLTRSSFHPVSTSKYYSRSPRTGVLNNFRSSCSNIGSLLNNFNETVKENTVKYRNFSASMFADFDYDVNEQEMKNLADQVVPSIPLQSEPTTKSLHSWNVNDFEIFQNLPLETQQLLPSFLGFQDSVSFDNYIYDKINILPVPSFLGSQDSDLSKKDFSNEIINSSYKNTVKDYSFETTGFDSSFKTPATRKLNLSTGNLNFETTSASMIQNNTYPNNDIPDNNCKDECTKLPIAISWKFSTAWTLKNRIDPVILGTNSENKLINFPETSGTLCSSMSVAKLHPKEGILKKFNAAYTANTLRLNFSVLDWQHLDNFIEQLSRLNKIYNNHTHVSHDVSTSNVLLRCSGPNREPSQMDFKIEKGFLDYLSNIFQSCSHQTQKPLSINSSGLNYSTGQIQEATNQTRFLQKLTRTKNSNKVQNMYAIELTVPSTTLKRKNTEIASKNLLPCLKKPRLSTSFPTKLVTVKTQKVLLHQNKQKCSIFKRQADLALPKPLTGMTLTNTSPLFDLKRRKIDDLSKNLFKIKNPRFSRAIAPNKIETKLPHRFKAQISSTSQMEYILPKPANLSDFIPIYERGNDFGYVSRKHEFGTPITSDNSHAKINKINPKMHAIFHDREIIFRPVNTSKNSNEEIKDEVITSYLNPSINIYIPMTRTPRITKNKIEEFSNVIGIAFKDMEIEKEKTSDIFYGKPILEHECCSEIQFTETPNEIFIEEKKNSLLDIQYEISKEKEEKNIEIFNETEEKIDVTLKETEEKIDVTLKETEEKIDVTLKETEEKNIEIFNVTLEKNNEPFKETQEKNIEIFKETCKEKNIETFDETLENNNLIFNEIEAKNNEMNRKSLKKQNETLNFWNEISEPNQNHKNRIDSHTLSNGQILFLDKTKITEENKSEIFKSVKADNFEIQNKDFEEYNPNLYIPNQVPKETKDKNYITCNQEIEKEQILFDIISNTERKENGKFELFNETEANKSYLEENMLNLHGISREENINEIFDKNVLGITEELKYKTQIQLEEFQPIKTTESKIINDHSGYQSRSILRLGLSRKQTVKPLHSVAKFNNYQK